MNSIVAGATARPPQDRSGTILLIIGLFLIVWPVYSLLSRYNLDVHGDMVENFAWAIGWQAGYYKHPPLFAWITAAWFTVLPRGDLFYFMLSALNVAVTLWAMWRISRRYFEPDRQILLVAAALLAPPLTFLATNYNATSAMLPFWALTFLFYLRVIERRTVADALLLGIFAALSMLAKYHSVVLLAALAVHVLADREVRPLLATKLPWIAALAALIVLAPHIQWMVRNDFITVSYASEQGDGDWRRTIGSVLRLLPVMALYALPAGIFLWLHPRLSGRRPMPSLRPIVALGANVRGRALLAAGILPVAFTILAGLSLNAPISSLWCIPFFVFVPFFVVLALPAQYAPASRRVAPVTLGLYGLVLLAAGPFIEDYNLSVARGSSAVPVDAIADRVQEEWRQHTGQPLTIVVADSNFLGNGISFYASDRPFAIQDESLTLTPWVSRKDIERYGAAAICSMADRADCQERLSSLIGGSDYEEIVSIPAVPGAGGPPVFEYAMVFRFPDGAASSQTVLD